MLSNALPLTTVRSRAIRLLHLDYQPQRYYWEVIEILRKLLLIGFSTLVHPGTYIQLLFAISISVVALGLHLAASPYRSTSDNLLAGGLLLMTLSFFFSSLLLKARGPPATLTAERSSHCSSPLP